MVCFGFVCFCLSLFWFCLFFVCFFVCLFVCLFLFVCWFVGLFVLFLLVGVRESYRRALQDIFLPSS